MPMRNTMPSKGVDIQPYKYNGKELDLMHGLNTYDYGARQYNPVTGRWDRMDPLSEKYYNVSPYNYCMNNPIMFLDPDGRDPNGWTRVWGALQMVGGAVEMVTSGAGEYFSGGTASPVAIPIFLNGVDNFQAGFQQMWTGEEQETVLHKSVEAATTSMGADKGTTATIVVAVDMASGNFKSPQKIGKMASGANSLLRGSKNLSVASKYGFGTYKELKKRTKGSGLEVHHLIEQRFAGLFEVKEGDMLSIVLTKKEHDAFTKAWRNEIGYAKDHKNTKRTNTVDRQTVINIAKKYIEIIQKY